MAVSRTASAMPRPPRLIAELLALTRSWGWTMKDLGRELGISEVTLAQLRSGRRRVSFDTFSHILDRFGDNAIIKGLAWQYARDYHKPEAVTAIVPPPNLAATTVHNLRRYVDGFAEELTHAARGLFVVSADAVLLTSAVSYLRQAFDTKEVQVVVLRADQEPAAADRRASLVVPLVIIERIEFLHPVVAEVLRRRDDILRPIIVTSTKDVAASGDEYLRRVFLSRMRRVDLVGTTASTPLISQPPLDAIA